MYHCEQLDAIDSIMVNDITGSSAQVKFNTRKWTIASSLLTAAKQLYNELAIN